MLASDIYIYMFIYYYNNNNKRKLYYLNLILTIYLIKSVYI